MNAQTWIPWIVAIVVAAATIINSWALELFRLRVKRTPVTAPDNPKSRSSKPSKRWRISNVFLWFLNAANIVFTLYRISRLLKHPTSNPSEDALFIAINVGVVFFLVGIFVLGYCLDLLRQLIDKVNEMAFESSRSTRDVIVEHFDITKSQGKIIDSLAKDVDELKRPKHLE